MVMRYGSVCSGIEAATMAWHPLGWKPAFFSEIEAFPCAVLAHHYPHVPNHGDMTKFEEWPDHAIDLLVGGTPCQSFSVAGLRQGLADPRGNLMLTYLAIARRYQPRWLVWENVPGVLSSNAGRDFGTFIRGLEECGYHAAWRVLDAQYFGVAQRRERVFVIGCLGDWRCAAASLLEHHSFEKTLPPARMPRDVWAFDNGLSERFHMPLGHDFSPCLIKTRGYCIADGRVIRKMTPVEAERVQGFPDDFTQVPYRSRNAADCPEGPRFEALGNSMAVNVMRWIGRRIDHVESLTADARREAA